MYLVIGSELDACCRRVVAALRAQGQPVRLCADPLAGEVASVWSLDGDRLTGQLRWADGPALAIEQVRGVLLRPNGIMLDVAGWSPEDLAYVRTEWQAALLAWLWSLPCPVINRISDDLWFRPQRPFPEWCTLLRRCGLPTPAIRVTNDPAAARQFAARWGEVTYAPLTSPTRYPIAGERPWAELDKVMQRMPVCLMEPCADQPIIAVVVGQAVVWAERGPASDRRFMALEDGLRRLAATLGLATCEVELRQGGDGPRCVGVDPYPRFERYDEATQEALTAGLVGLLGGDR
jgi:hypothetical protein